MTGTAPTQGSGGEAPAPDSAKASTHEAEFTNKQVASGSTWTVIAFGLASAFRLGSSVVLTRIFPDPTSVYGVMALVFAFYTGLLLFSDFGIGLLLTQDPRGMEPAFRHTAFTAQILRGFLIWLAAIALAVYGWASLAPGDDRAALWAAPAFAVACWVGWRDDAIEAVMFAAIATGQDINNPSDFVVIRDKLRTIPAAPSCPASPKM